LQSLGAFLQAAANLVPLFYTSLFAVSLSYSENTGVLFIALSNGVNAISRILMGFLADKVGRQNTMVATVFMSALAVLTLWLHETRVTFISFGNFQNANPLIFQWSYMR
jgi:nitrate/nitrite transporter NarK